MKGGADQDAELFEVFAKLHVLHATGKEPITSQGVADTLNRRGYSISSRSALQLLRSFARRGWVRTQNPAQGKTPQFRSTRAGQKTLRELQARIAVLQNELSGMKRSKSG